MKYRVEVIRTSEEGVKSTRTLIVEAKTEAEALKNVPKVFTRKGESANITVRIVE